MPHLGNPIGASAMGIYMGSLRLVSAVTLKGVPTDGGRAPPERAGVDAGVASESQRRPDFLLTAAGGSLHSHHGFRLGIAEVIPRSLRGGPEATFLFPGG